MLDSITNSVAGNISVVNAGTGGVSIEDIQKYGKYIEVLRNLGRLKENEKPLVDMKNKTLVADNRILQWIPVAALMQRHYSSGFDPKIVKDAFTFLRKCRKKGCQGSLEHRVWCDEITREFKKVGIDHEFDYNGLKNAKSADDMDALFVRAEPEHQGLKRVLKYYFNSAHGLKLRKCVIRVGRQFHKIQPPAAAPAAPPMPGPSTVSRAPREREPRTIRSLENPAPVSAGSLRMVKLPVGDAAAIQNRRDSLRRNSAYVPALPTEKKSLNETDNKNRNDLALTTSVEKDPDIERQLAKVAAVQMMQSSVGMDEWARSLMRSPLIASVKKSQRQPSVENLTEWSEVNQQDYQEPKEHVAVNNVNRATNYVVTKVGTSSVIVDEKSLRHGLKKALKHKLKAIHAVNVSEDESA